MGSRVCRRRSTKKAAPKDGPLRRMGSLGGDGLRFGGRRCRLRGAQLNYEKPNVGGLRKWTRPKYSGCSFLRALSSSA